MSTEPRIFTHRPAWPPTGATYRESFEFKTNIFTARDGTEYRSSERELPRRQVSFTTFLVDKASRRSYQTFMRNPRREEVDWLPDWIRFRGIVGAVPAGAMSVPTTAAGPQEVPGSIDWSRPSMFAVIVPPTGDAQLVKLTGRSATHLEFENPLTHAVPAGSRIYAALPGRLQERTSATNITNGVSTVGVVFDVDPTYPSLLDSEGVLYKGLRWIKKPNWASSTDTSIMKALDTLDYGYGRVEVVDHIKYPTLITNATYLNVNEADYAQSVSTFLKARGRQAELRFMIPGDADAALDMRENWSLNLGSKSVQSLSFEGPWAALDYLQPDLNFNNAIALVLRDGRTVTLKVVQAGGSSGDAYLSVMVRPQPAVEFTERIYKKDVLYIGWCHAGRFASDTLSVEHLAVGVSQFQVALEQKPGADIDVWEP